MMYGFKDDLTKENIFKKISSYDVFKAYCENFQEVNKKFKSDLRPDDTNPSCCISQIKGDLLYTDFGEGSYRAVDYVMRKFNLTFIEALLKLNADFNLNLSVTTQFIGELLKTTPKINPKIDFKEKSHATIQKKRRDFTKQDLEYWNNFYWTEWMLKESKTESISHYWINGYMWKVKSDDLAFSYEYYWHDKRQMRKLYFPLRDKYKWFSNVDNSIVQLVDVAPKSGDYLFITSSKKDGGIFWRMQLNNMFPGKVIHGVAPNAESAFVPEEWFSKMKERWTNIIIWYNNDWDKSTNTGVVNAQRYGEKYNLPYFYNPDRTPKDPSDFSKKFGLLEFKKLLDPIITK